MPAISTLFPRPCSPHRLHLHCEGIFGAQTSVSHPSCPTTKLRKTINSVVHAPCGARLKTPAAGERSCNVRAPPLTLGSVRAPPLTLGCGKKYLPQSSTKHTGFFFLPLHALTCRHPCQRGGARGSHARVDLGDLLTARMSGAGRAGRSIIQQPPLRRRPSPLPQLQPQPPRANLQTVPSGACVQHLRARIVGCYVAHQRARPPCARQHVATVGDEAGAVAGAVGCGWGWG
jgi:hypothetical protein